MKSQNLKTNFANIVIRVVRAFNVPVRDELSSNQQQRASFPSAIPNEGRNDWENAIDTMVS